MDLDSCRFAYITYLRGINSGQVKPTGVDEPEENDYSTLLERERYREKKRQNDLEEARVAPVELLTDALQAAGNKMIPILDSLPLHMKRYWPEITGDQVILVKRAVAECRNAIADMEIRIDS